MAGPRRLKLGEMVEGMFPNVCAKKNLGSVHKHQDQVRRPHVPLLGHGNEMEAPNLSLRSYW